MPNGTALLILELDSAAPPPSAFALVRAGARAAAAAVELRERVFAAPARELAALRALGAAVRVRAADASEYYAARLLREAPPRRRALRAPSGPPAPPSAMAGGMGGYPTLAEAEAAVRQMARAHPAVARLVAIGASVEGRPILALCLTADAAAHCAPPPAGARFPRPAALFTALTHSREPVTLVALLQFARGLIEAHAAGARRERALLAARRLWFVFALNPDGYEANRRSRPAGGGTKRKNGRAGGRCRLRADEGVDINRNFGFRFGSDDAGSSPRACAEDYRGRAPFSEPEAAALARLMGAQRVRVVLHLHGWGNSLTHPFGYSALDSIRRRTPLSRAQLLLYRRWAHDMCATAGCVYGRAWETVGYEANGLPDDWAHAQLGAASMTVELGSARDGFWPPRARVPAISAQLATLAGYVSRLGGSLLRPSLLELTPASRETAGGGADSGAAELVVRVRLTVDNVGMRPAGAAAAVRVRARRGGSLLVEVRAAEADGGAEGGAQCAWLAGSAAEGWGDDDASGGSQLAAPAHLVARLPPRLGSHAPAACAELELRIRRPPGERAGGAGGTNVSDSRGQAAPSSLLAELELELELCDGDEADASAPHEGACARAVAGSSLVEAHTVAIALAPAPAEVGGLGRGDGGTLVAERCAHAHRCWCEYGGANAWHHGSACERGAGRQLACDNPTPRALPAAAPGAGGARVGSLLVPGSTAFFAWTPNAFAGAHECSLVAESADAILVVYEGCSRWGPVDAVGFGTADRGSRAKLTFECVGGRSYLVYSNGENGGGAFRLNYREACPPSRGRASGCDSGGLPAPPAHRPAKSGGSPSARGAASLGWRGEAGAAGSGEADAGADPFPDLTAGFASGRIGGGGWQGAQRHMRAKGQPWGLRGWAAPARRLSLSGAELGAREPQLLGERAVTLLGANDTRAPVAEGARAAAARSAGATGTDAAGARGAPPGTRAGGAGEGVRLRPAMPASLPAVLREVTSLPAAERAQRPPADAASNAALPLGGAAGGDRRVAAPAAAPAAEAQRAPLVRAPAAIVASPRASPQPAALPAAARLPPPVPLLVPLLDASLALAPRAHARLAERSARHGSFGGGAAPLVGLELPPRLLPSAGRLWLPLHPSLLAACVLAALALVCAVVARPQQLLGARGSARARRSSRSRAVRRLWLWRRAGAKMGLHPPPPLSTIAEAPEVWSSASSEQGDDGRSEHGFGEGERLLSRAHSRGLSPKRCQGRHLCDLPDGAGAVGAAQPRANSQPAAASGCVAGLYARSADSSR